MTRESCCKTGRRQQQQQQLHEKKKKVRAGKPTSRERKELGAF